MYQDNILQIKDNIKQVIIGKDDIINMLLAALISGGHVLLEDVPGTGKTVMAKTLAKSIGGKFSRIQFTPDLLPSDVTGINYYNRREDEFVFRPGPVFCNILLADEINRATPRTQSSLLECMEEKQVTTDGETRALSSVFFVIATQNPVETAGTFPLPEAQLDRFMMKLSMGLPTKDEEIMIMNRFLKETPETKIKAVCSLESLLEMKNAYKDVYIHPLLMEYIADIIIKTRFESAVLLGVSPRGTLAFINALRAFAMVSGRGFVTPEDIKLLAHPVLAHRIVMRGESAALSASFINSVLDSVPVPTEDWSRH